MDVDKSEVEIPALIPLLFGSLGLMASPPLPLSNDSTAVLVVLTTPKNDTLKNFEAKLNTKPRVRL